MVKNMSSKNIDDLTLALVISEILRKKTVKGLKPTIDCQEFQKIVTALENLGYNVQDKSFTKTSTTVINNNQTNFYGMELYLEDNKLKPTYLCLNKKIYNPLKESKINNFIYFYVLDLENKKDYSLKDFDFSKIDEKQKKIIAQLSLFIYGGIQQNTKQKYDPKVLYKNISTVLAWGLEELEKIEISNNPDNCLAYSFFYQMLKPCNLVSNFNIVDPNSKEFYIKTSKEHFEIKKHNYIPDDLPKIRQQKKFNF